MIIIIYLGKKSTVINFEELKSTSNPILPSQAFVTALAHIFPLLFTHIKVNDIIFKCLFENKIGLQVVSPYEYFTIKS